MVRTYRRFSRQRIGVVKQRTADPKLITNKDFIKADLLIGIDPGLKTGLAEYIRSSKKLTLDTTDFWGFIDYLNINRFLRQKFFVIIEDPNLNPAMHWQQHSAKGSINYGARIAQNVGGNKKEAELIIKYMETHKIPYYRYKPTKSKWTEEEFKKYTGYKVKCSQHARDAAAMVWGL